MDGSGKPTPIVHLEITQTSMIGEPLVTKNCSTVKEPETPARFFKEKKCAAL